jgi:alpha-glucosidase
MSDLPWWKSGIVYQIYPRSFADSDGDGIGDLRGIIARLDYLNDGTRESLGVDAIWISPFYPSPMADFGYDVSDYTDVDELFGTLADFDKLLEDAHRRDIKVIIDWVPNHTSHRHPWFVESRSSRQSGKRDWYVWRDPAPDGGPPNNWKSTFGGGGVPAWTYEEATTQYYLHSFLPQQPDLNWENPEVEAAMRDVLRFWLDRGVDGFRIDVVHKLGKDPDLGDNPLEVVEPIAGYGGRRHDQDWLQVHERLKSIRKMADDYENKALIGEVYILDQLRLVQYINSGDQLHLVHNFVFLHLPWDASAFRDTVDAFESLASEAAWPAWFLNNHDHSRVGTRFDEGGQGRARSRVAAMLLFTLRGTPFIYQGEEFGLRDTLLPAGSVVDVDGRDPVRTPFPWEPPSTAGSGAGFTTGEPWLPLTDEAERLNAATQSSDPGSLLSLYRKLIWYRRRSPALQVGRYRSVDAGPELYAYMREAEGTRFLVALNFSTTAQQIAGAAKELRRGRLELSTDPVRDSTPIELGDVELGGNEGIVIRL